MNSEIQLISDGDGLAVIGDSKAVERFLTAEGLPSKDLGLPRLGKVLNAGGAAAQVGSEFGAQSGRWVKLSSESAQKVKQYGLMESKTPGVSHAMVGEPGNIKSWLQVTQGPRHLPRIRPRLPVPRGSWRNWPCNRPWTRSPTIW